MLGRIKVFSEFKKIRKLSQTLVLSGEYKVLSDRSIRVPPTTGGRPVYEKRRKNAYPIYIRYEIVDDQWYFQSKEHLASRTNFAHIKCSQV